MEHSLHQTHFSDLLCYKVQEVIFREPASDAWSVYSYERSATARLRLGRPELFNADDMAFKLDLLRIIGQALICFHSSSEQSD